MAVKLRDGHPFFALCISAILINSYGPFVSGALSGGCTHDIDCDDGLPCTFDWCDFPQGGPVGAGVCQHDPVPDGQPGGVGGAYCLARFGPLCGGCDDGLFCNGAETCQGGVCAPGTPPCSGGQVCSESLDLCQPGPCSETKVCVGGPTPGAVCTGNNNCGTGGLCRFADCHDGLHCNGEEICVSGVCQAGENPCGVGAICGERQCSQGSTIDICITDEDCAGGLGTCSWIGPVCLLGRCCNDSTEPTCSRRPLGGLCSGSTVGTNAGSTCFVHSDCNNGSCIQLAASCTGISGFFYPGDAPINPIPSGGSGGCPQFNGIPMRCPKFGGGVSPYGPLIRHVGPVNNSSLPNADAGVPMNKLGDDYEFSNTGVCVGGNRNGLGCANDTSCPNGGFCNLAGPSVMSINYLRIRGAAVVYSRLVVEFYDSDGRFVTESYADNATLAALERFYFNPPVIIPSKGFVVLRIASEYTPNGGFVWSSTDAVDIGANDPDVLWINNGPVANFLAPDPGILAFEFEGEKVAAPLGACCNSDGVACADGVLPWVCEGDGNVFQGVGTTCPDPACDSGACCDPATGQCSVGSESDCTNAGGDFQGYGTDCDVDDGHDTAAQHCCPQPYTAADRCEDAIVHLIDVPPPGSVPVVVTISGDNTPALFQTNDYCCSDDCYVDFGWWEAFEIDAYAYVRIDLCCSEPVHRRFHRSLFDCPCGQAIFSSANPFNFPEPGYALGNPYCDDGNPWVSFGPLPPGRYFYPVYSTREGVFGPYQLHITVAALPTAACCVADQCTDGVNQVECDALGGVFLAPPQKSPMVADCSESPCATGSCCTGPGQCFDNVAGQPATLADCINVQATYSGGVRCFGGSCSGHPELSCRVASGCPGNGPCLGTPQQYAQPSPCPLCSIEGHNNCQPFVNTLSFTLSDRSLGIDGLLAADDFRPEGTTINRVCVWGFYLNIDPNASVNDCGPLIAEDHFRVRVFANDPVTGRSPGSLVAQRTATAQRGILPGTLIYTRLQTQVYGHELILDTPITGLTPGAVYWLEVSNDVSDSHTYCNWFWMQQNESPNGYSFLGGESGYNPLAATQFNNSFCLNTPFQPLPLSQLSGACCTCDGNCAARTLYDCARSNGVWDVTRTTCDGVVCSAGPPPNDNCIAGPQLITEGTYTVHNQCATTDGFGPIPSDFFSTQVDFDLWFHYVASGTCDLVVSECQTGLVFDSALAVYANCPGGPVNGCDPAICPPCPLNAVTSATHLAGIVQDESCVGVAVGGAGYWRASEQILREALPGECFLIRAGSFPGSRGTAILDVSCPVSSNEPPGPVIGQTNLGCISSGVPHACCTAFRYGNCDKNRFISMIPPEDSVGVVALRVRLTSLHHVNPPYTAAPSVPFTAFEGLALYVGPPENFVESTAAPIPFRSAALQCQPYYHDWSTVGLLHVRGSAIVPSSTYHVEVLAASCNGNEGAPACQAGGASVSPAVPINTSRWGDVVSPYNPPSPIPEPDFADVAAMVDKFRNLPNSLIKARALMVGTDAFGTLDVANDFSFTHIAACVDAFRGRAYPHEIQSCP